MSVEFKALLLVLAILVGIYVLVMLALIAVDIKVANDELKRFDNLHKKKR